MVFLDIEMPGMKGLDVLREIRTREKDFPVVMITAYGSIDLAVEAMKEGAYDFVPKPFKPSHIALVVEKALKGNDSAAKRKCFPKKSTSVTALSPVIVQNLTRPSAAQRKLQGARARFYYWGRGGPAKSFRQGDSQLERKKRPALYCYQLRRSFKGAVGERTVWLRKRRLYRRESA